MIIDGDHTGPGVPSQAKPCGGEWTTQLVGLTTICRSPFRRSGRSRQRCIGYDGGNPRRALAATLAIPASAFIAAPMRMDASPTRGTTNATAAGSVFGAEEVMLMIA